MNITYALSDVVKKAHEWFKPGPKGIDDMWPQLEHLIYGQIHDWSDGLKVGGLLSRYLSELITGGQPSDHVPKEDRQRLCLPSQVQDFVSFSTPESGIPEHLTSNIENLFIEGLGGF